VYLQGDSFPVEYISFPLKKVTGEKVGFSLDSNKINNI